MLRIRLFFILGLALALLFIYKLWLALLCLAALAAWLLLRRRAAAVRLAREDWLDAQGDAERALAGGDFKKALLRFEKAGWLAPGEAGTAHSELKILIGKARALMGLGRQAEAVPVLKEALSLAASLPGGEAAGLAQTARELLKKTAAPTGAPPAGPLSPWADSAELRSPDGRFTASMPSALETGMGAPTLGLLQLSGGLRLKDCSPAMIWSEDSRYLAVPRWETARSQRLLIVDVAAGKIALAPGNYSILQPETFSRGVYTGVDSPRHRPRPVRVELKDLVF